ncbi:hypothetical protein BJY52DRAFT_1227634 [Lactarius psammicola]|nr:hypothetical protein BJY52DRAFT_1227634 [Lactarius psammicola]
MITGINVQTFNFCMSYCPHSDDPVFNLKSSHLFKKFHKDIDRNVNEDSHMPVRFSSSQTFPRSRWLRFGTSSDSLGAGLLSSIGEADSVGWRECDRHEALRGYCGLIRTVRINLMAPANNGDEVSPLANIIERSALSTRMPLPGLTERGPWDADSYTLVAGGYPTRKPEAITESCSQLRSVTFTRVRKGGFAEAAARGINDA